jgi:hypothetical protein
MAYTMLGAQGYASVLSDSPQEKGPAAGSVTYQAPPLERALWNGSPWDHPLGSLSGNGGHEIVIRVVMEHG